MTGATSSGNGGKYTYYFCCNDQKHIRVRAEEANENFARYTANLKPNKAILEMYHTILEDLRSENKQEQRKIVAGLQDDLYKIEQRKHKVEDKYIDGEISNEQYQNMLTRFDKETAILRDRIDLLTAENRKRIEPQLKYFIDLISNIDKYVRDAPIEAKTKLLGSMFPEKIEFDGKNYRTENYNKVLNIIYQQTNDLQGNKKTETSDFSEISVSVPRANNVPSHKQNR